MTIYYIYRWFIEISLFYMRENLSGNEYQLPQVLCSNAADDVIRVTSDFVLSIQDKFLPGPPAPLLRSWHPNDVIIWWHYVLYEPGHVGGTSEICTTSGFLDGKYPLCIKIENDTELKEVETILHVASDPPDTISQLSLLASKYIREQLSYMEKEIRALHDWDFSDDHDCRRYAELLSRRLLLMQTDIFILCDPLFVSQYLRDLRALGVDGSPEMQSMLREFFLAHPLPEVGWHEAVAEEKKDICDYDEPIEVRTYERDYIWEIPPPITMIAQDIFRITLRTQRLFSEPEFKNLREASIIPFLQFLERKYPLEIDDLNIAMSPEVPHILWSLSVHDRYTDLVKRIDTTYGRPYRKRLQRYASNPNSSLNMCGNIPLEHPDITLLFFIENISHATWYIAPQIMKKIVQKYFPRLDQKGMLLLGWLLSHISPQYAIEFFIWHWDLNIPEAMYLVTESLKLIDEDVRKIMIQELDQSIKSEGRGDSFFQYTRALYDARNKNTEAREKNFLLHLRNNLQFLEEKKDAIFVSTKWLIQTARSHEDTWQYQEALECYERSFFMQQNKDGLIHILDCAIQWGNFEKAEKYIQHGLREGYDITAYIIAYSLMTSNTRWAFFQVIQMMKETHIELPEWIETEFQNAIDWVINVISILDSAKAKVLGICATYILARRYNDGVFHDFHTHWKHMDALIDLFVDWTEWDQQDTILLEVLQALTWNNTMWASPGHILQLLHIHANNLYWIRKKRSSPGEQKNICELVSQIINTLGKISGFEQYREIWTQRRHTPA